MALSGASGVPKKGASVHIGHLELPVVHPKEPPSPSTSQRTFCVEIVLPQLFNFSLSPVLNSTIQNSLGTLGSLFIKTCYWVTIARIFFKSFFMSPLHPHCSPSKKLSSCRDDLKVISADPITDSEKTAGVKSGAYTTQNLVLGKYGSYCTYLLAKGRN